MEKTLRSGEEDTVGLEEGKSSKDENEVSVSYSFSNLIIAINNY